MIAHFLEMLLMSLYHLWIRSRAGPRRQKRKAAADPPGDPGRVAIGKTRLSPMDRARLGPGAPKELALTDEERGKHLYLIGGTGTGKTNLTLNLVMSDIRRGRAVCLVDARGDLADRVMMRLAADPPPGLEERLMAVDLRQACAEWVVPCNPLAEPGRDPYSRAAFVLDVLKRLYDIGVQTEEALRNALLALSMADPPYSLLEVEPLLTAAAFRNRVLAQVADPAVRRYFRRYDELGAGQAAVAGPVLNKLALLLSRPVLKNCLGMRAGLPLRESLRERTDLILLVSLASDELFGASGLLGSLVVSAIASAVMRTDRPEAARTPVRVYADEFENFLGAAETFEQMLQEGRRFGLGLTLSHQSCLQLPPRLRGLIRNVVAVQAIFATGALDSETLANEIATDDPKPLVRNLIQNQKLGEAYVVRRGETPLRITTYHNPDPEVEAEKVDELRRKALARYGRPRAEVEAEIAERDRGYEQGPGAPPPQASRSKKAAAPGPTAEATGPPIGGEQPVPKTKNASTKEVRDIDPDRLPRRGRRPKGGAPEPPETEVPPPAPD